MTVRTYKFCNDCFSFQSHDTEECVSFECCKILALETIFIQSKSHISLRSIRRRRKYVRLVSRVHKKIVTSKAFRQAMFDLLLFGRGETYITASDVTSYE